MQAAGMDIDALHSALLSLTLLPEQLRSARETLAASDHDAHSALGEFLHSTECDLRIAKITLARELGFPVCRCCWPPELLTTDAEGATYCPATARQETAAPEMMSPDQTVPTHTKRSAMQSHPRRRLDHFARLQKRRLLGMREAIVASLAGNASNLRDATAAKEEFGAGKDSADAGNDAADCDLALNLLAQGRDALGDIDDALRRVELGVYGICEMSGKPIPHARLEAIPFARFTVECQAEIEKQRRASRTRHPVTPIFDPMLEEESAGDDDMVEEEENAGGRQRQPNLSQRIADAERPKHGARRLAAA